MSPLTLSALSSGRRNRPITTAQSGPHNVDSFLTFTDPYGHAGSVVHPDVIDFGVTGWRGHRFWMVCTPYYGKNARLENPSIYYADTPTGFVEAATNPIYPPPADTNQWNSDPEIVHDPDTDELVVLFRDGAFTPRVARSSDGITWPTSTTPLAMTGVSGEIVSPTLLRIDGQWHMWGVTHPSRVMYRWTAPNIEGPWSPGIACTGWPADIWHFNIIRRGRKLLCLMHYGWVNGTAYAASSDDGLAWTQSPQPVLVRGRAGKWDADELYRSAITLHENGTHMRVWYSGLGSGSDSWRMALAEVPLSEWPWP